MPRQSSASRQFAVRSSERLRPPAELTAAEKKIFLDIVINNPPAHFRPSDLPLLNAYTRAVAMELKFARLIGKDDKAMMQWERSIKCMTALSLRLRLSPQSRTPTHTAPRPSSNGVTPPPNYYERMQLEGDA